MTYKLLNCLFFFVNTVSFSQSVFIDKSPNENYFTVEVSKCGDSLVFNSSKKIRSIEIQNSYFHKKFVVNNRRLNYSVKDLKSGGYSVYISYKTTDSTAALSHLRLLKCPCD